MVLYLWGGTLLVDNGKLAAAPACCCDTGPGTCCASADWSAVEVNGISLVKGASYTACDAGCDPGEGPTASDIWFGENAAGDLQFWVWTETDALSCGGPDNLKYNFYYADCRGGTPDCQYTFECCDSITRDAQNRAVMEQIGSETFTVLISDC